MTALGRSPPIVTTECAGQVECNLLISTKAIDWSVTMQMGGQVHAITHLRSPGHVRTQADVWSQDVMLLVRVEKNGGGLMKGQAER